MTPDEEKLLREMYDVKLTAQTALQMIRDHAADCLATRVETKKGFEGIGKDMQDLKRAQNIVYGICLTLGGLSSIIGSVFMIWKMTHGTT